MYKRYRCKVELCIYKGGGHLSKRMALLRNIPRKVISAIVWRRTTGKDFWGHRCITNITAVVASLLLDVSDVGLRDTYIYIKLGYTTTQTHIIIKTIEMDI